MEKKLMLRECMIRELSTILFVICFGMFAISLLIKSFFDCSMVSEVIVGISMFLLLAINICFFRDFRYKWKSIIHILFPACLIYNLVINHEQYFIVWYAEIAIPMYMLAVLFCKMPMDIEKITLYTMMLSIPFVLFGEKVWQNSMVERLGGEQLNLGVSYILLPIVIAFMLHFTYYRKKSIGILILYIINCMLLAKMLFTATRGAVLSLILLGGYLIVDHSTEKVKIKEKILPLFLGGLIGVLFFALQNEIVEYLFDFVCRNNLFVGFINKSYTEILANANIYNGRDVVWERAWDMILLNSMGSIGRYEDAYGEYPHNIILQLMLEYGFLFGTGIFVWLIYLFYKGITNFFEVKIFTLLTFFSVFPKLMVSSAYWREGAFWFFLIMTSYYINNKANLLRGRCDE